MNRPNSCAAVKRGRKTLAELEEEPGIKAQHAVFRALSRLLTLAGTGWSVEETEVGSFDDVENGTDIRLISPDGRQHRLLDVSLGDKPHKDGMLLRVYHDWFDEKPDGRWELKPEKERALIRSILPTLESPAIYQGG